VIIHFVDEAQEEFLDAISFYEGIRTGLGRRLKDEADCCVLWIADHAELYRVRPGGYRRINLRGFPYYVPYVVRERTLWVLAVAHASRKPLYWISRVNDAT
jgi:toxin ParE1/3/4